ncbi:Hsp70 family protein [Micromonospora sp. HM5-17]|jgi:molecular chaperone DnaK (HSP70)|uniref:Hsp70 family protein n=1 Tax=Micromonospora sp. HM5-17 TaxID=2487710 RepID=UPI000F491DDE|nr:Hsp70 family protein [Micromonospora sp. HM5-17]ROT32329.1 Hsp70 family protein [Micromonospora sp. HM5-17]
MPYVLGVDIGSTSTAAAVIRPRGSTWEHPEAVPLSPTAHPVPSVLLMSPNRALTVADPDDQDERVDPGWVARGFFRRVGDDVPLLVGGELCPAQALTATLAMWVVERVVAREGERPDWIVLSHPAGWGSYRRHLLQEALWEVGLTEVSLLPGPVAVAAAHAAAGRGGRTLAVHTLGGDTFEPAVVDRAQPLGYTLRGVHPEPEPLGGADFDDLLVEHLRTGWARDLSALADPAVRSALAELRRECRRAKVELSGARSVEIRVRLPHRELRRSVTRAEFEGLIRPAVAWTVDELARTVRARGLRPEDLDGVLLAGGSARIPLLRDLLAARFPVPIETGADPQLTVALGAAVAGSQILDRQRGNRPPPRPPVMRPPRPGFGRPDPAARRGRARSAPDSDGVGRYDDARDLLPPRPPIRITPLELPMRVLSRRAAGRG